MEASTEYLVNKPLQAVVCRLIMFSRGREIAQKIIFGREGKLQRQIRNFEGNLSRPRLLSADIPASQTGVYSVYSPSINFCTFRAAFETSFVLPLIITITISSNVIGASAASFFINHSEQL